MNIPANWAGPLALLGAISFWGFVPTVTRFLVGTLSPEHILMFRFFFGGLVVVAAILTLRPALPKRQDMPKAIALGVFGAIGFNVPVAFGINIIEGGTAALLIGMQPIFIAVLAALRLREHISVRIVAGLCLALTGSSIIALTGQTGFTFSGRYVFGCLLVLTGALAYAVYSVVVKPVLGDQLPAQSIAMIGTLGAMPVFLPFGGPGFLDALAGMTPGEWLAGIFLAAGASVAAPTLFAVGLSLGEASRSGMYLYLVPVVGVISSVILLGEDIDIATALGGALALSGVILATFSPGRSRESPSARTAAD